MGEIQVKKGYERCNTRQRRPAFYTFRNPDGNTAIQLVDSRYIGLDDVFRGAITLAPDIDICGSRHVDLVGT